MEWNNNVCDTRRGGWGYTESTRGPLFSFAPRSAPTSPLSNRGKRNQVVRYETKSNRNPDEGGGGGGWPLAVVQQQLDRKLFPVPTRLSAISTVLLSQFGSNCSDWVWWLYYDRILEHLFAPCAGLEKKARWKDASRLVGELLFDAIIYIYVRGYYCLRKEKFSVKVHARKVSN